MDDLKNEVFSLFDSLIETLEEYGCDIAMLHQIEDLRDEFATSLGQIMPEGDD